jgi:hypothetical protein
LQRITRRIRRKKKWKKKYERQFEEPIRVHTLFIGNHVREFDRGCQKKGRDKKRAGREEKKPCLPLVIFFSCEKKPGKTRKNGNGFYDAFVPIQHLPLYWRAIDPFPKWPCEKRQKLSNAGEGGLKRQYFSRALSVEEKEKRKYRDQCQKYKKSDCIERRARHFFSGCQKTCVRDEEGRDEEWMHDKCH